MTKFYVLHKHLKACWYASGKNDIGGSVWVCPIVKTADTRRDKTKKRRGWNHDYLVYRCNDPKCGAELAIHTDYVAFSLSVNVGELRMAGRRK